MTASPGGPWGSGGPRLRQVSPRSINILIRFWVFEESAETALLIFSRGKTNPRKNKRAPPAPRGRLGVPLKKFSEARVKNLRFAYFENASRNQFSRLGPNVKYVLLRFTFAPTLRISGRCDIWKVENFENVDSRTTRNPQPFILYSEPNPRGFVSLSLGYWIKFYCVAIAPRASPTLFSPPSIQAGGQYQHA